MISTPEWEESSGKKADSVSEAFEAGVLSMAQYTAYWALAYSGSDVYCYTAGSEGNWYLWDGTAIDPQTGYKGVRIPLTKK